MTVQWYPGHMAKAKRTLEDNLKLVNIVIELCDARLPYSSRNPAIDRIIGKKPRVLVFNKADLADPAQSEYWMEYYKKQGFTVVFTDARAGDGVKKVIAAVKKAMEEKVSRSLERGRIATTLYAMVVGIPNVGKSSFVNKVSGKAAAKTGDKPGVTREKQWLNMGDDIYLLDTPGLLWPRIDNQMAALRLAASGAIKDEVVDSGELCAFLLTFIDSHYPGLIEGRYNIKIPELSGDEERDYVTETVIGAERLEKGLAILEACGRARGCLVKGGEVDLGRAAALVLDDFRAGKTGKISLDFPEVLGEEADMAVMNEERMKQKEEKRAARKANYRSRKNGKR
ncbi:MAG: ribosome biogenesis GTPase YlqF [Clostridia bacterium]|nr:ribosome biogenesis GTPase YlqF [Clostridia bacterium]